MLVLSSLLCADARADPSGEIERAGVLNMLGVEVGARGSAGLGLRTPLFAGADARIGLVGTHLSVFVGAELSTGGSAGPVLAGFEGGFRYFPNVASSAPRWFVGAHALVGWLHDSSLTQSGATTLALAGSIGLELPRTSFVRLCLRAELEPGVTLGALATGVLVGTFGVSGVLSDPQLE